MRSVRVVDGGLSWAHAWSGLEGRVCDWEGISILGPQHPQIVIIILNIPVKLVISCPLLSLFLGVEVLVLDLSDWADLVSFVCLSVTEGVVNRCVGTAWQVVGWTFLS